MAVQTSKVTTASNGTLQLDPNGSGQVQLTKLAGSGNQPVGVDNTGNTQKFLPSTTADRGTPAGSDIVMVQADGASTVTKTTITALVTAGGGGGGGVALTDFSVTTASPGTATGGLSYNSANGVFTFTPVSGVSKIIAGSNVVISPTDGLGEVTISAAGGGGGGTLYTGTNGVGFVTGSTTEFQVDINSLATR